MFDNQSFGHFGAPETLSHGYGSESTQPNGQHVAFGSEPVSEPPPYIRNGKPLPNLKGGATDLMVQDDRGILGLVSEIQRRMGVVSPSGVITTSEIKAYQKSNGLSDDGIIGPQTYTKLGFKPPFGSSSRPSSSGSSAPSSNLPAIGGKPWYKSTWFLTTITVLALGGGAYLLLPKEE